MCTPGSGITLDRFMRVAHLLPRQRGSVAVDDYTFVNVLLWMCRTGAPCVLLQCLFDRFGSVFPQCGLMVFPGVVIVSR